MSLSAARPGEGGSQYSPMAMRRRLFVSVAIFAILVVAPVRGIADLVEVANSIRSTGCEDWTVVKTPLSRHAQLDEAAQRIAHGERLEKAISESGYRARRSASIHIRTAKGDDGIARILVRRFCGIVADSTLHEIGIFRRGEEAWMVLAAPFAPPVSDAASAVSRRVLELINEARSRAHTCGRKRFPATTQLQRVVALDRAALAHAQDMAANSYIGHKGRDGSLPADRVTRVGYAWASVAENVAAGHTSAEEVVDAWLASPGHCANLMSSRYTHTGVAYAVTPVSKKEIFWAQVFAAPE